MIRLDIWMCIEPKLASCGWCCPTSTHLRCCHCICGWYICGGLTGHPAWLVLWIVFDLDTPISLLLVICLLVLLFAVSVVGCLLGSSSCLVVWIPLFLDPSDGAFGRFDLAALCGCRTLNFCLFVYIASGKAVVKCHRLYVQK